MSAQQASHTVLIAVPYYGSLSMPPLGLSRVFFFAAVDSATGKLRRVGIEVWDPNQEPNLSVWMREQGVCGVICSDSGSHFTVALQAQNIWLIGNKDGEAAELAERWAAGALGHPSRQPGQGTPWRPAGSRDAAIAA